MNYAVKSNYLLELLSTVDGLDARLAKPRAQPFQDFERLGAFLLRAVGQVIAEETTIAGARVAQPEKAPSTAAFPRSWVSLTSGNQFSIRLDEPYLQWIQLSPRSTVNAVWVAAQGEARHGSYDNSFVGFGLNRTRFLWTPSGLR